MSFTPRIKAILWILTWSISFTTTMAINKTLSHAMSDFTKVFVRSVFGYVFLFPLIFHTGLKKTFTTNHLPLHLLRAILGGGAIAATYYAYSHLTMSLATTIGFTQPMVIALFAILFLREWLSWDKWVAIIAGYVGVLIAINPFQYGFDPDIFIAFLANILSSGAIILSRKLTKTDTNATILVYFNTIVMCLSGVLAFFHWTPLETSDLIRLFFMGGMATLSQYSYVQAVRHGEASLVAPFEYSRLVFAIPVGLFFFSEPVHFSTLLAALIIVGSNLYMVYKRNPSKHP